MKDGAPESDRFLTDAYGFGVSGRVALVTGGNSGIGRASALALARAGASVAIIGRDEERNAAVLDELRASGASASAFQVDVTDRTQLDQVVPRVERELGPLSILVNNAGVGAGKGVLEIEIGEWDRILETNLTAPFLLTKYAAESMVQRRSGKIINIGSIGGLLATTSPAFGASKAGLLHLTRCAARELGPYNVQVNAIAPGWIDTGMTGRVKFGPRYKGILERTPARRWGDPVEVAAAVVYLASSASDFVNGATLVVDGGLTIGPMA